MAPLDVKPNELEPYWIPFTANRAFKKRPRLFAGAKGMHYFKPDGAKVIDATSGLFCVNAGHCREPIVKAIQEMAAKLDYSPAFQYGHPKVFELASRLSLLAPGDLDYAFFSNSGSEAVDTALKIALAYHKAKGEGARIRLIGRERGYHGVNFGGISVGGIVSNRKMFGTMLTGVDHMPHTHLPAKNAFTRGEPAHGAELADELERIVNLYGAENVAACFVEPIAGSTGCLVPPKGYLKRLREICDRHGILLVFDEVQSGIGRTGKMFAAEHFGVAPDIMTLAKGLGSGLPIGMVVAKKTIMEKWQKGAHGNTYGGNPICCAAALATVDLVEREYAANAARTGEYFINKLRELKLRYDCIGDVRGKGLMLGMELVENRSTKTPAADLCDRLITRSYYNGLLLLMCGQSTIRFMPPLMITNADVDEALTILTASLDEVLANDKNDSAAAGPADALRR
jgi:beta-alanine--pyruvate transaminase